MGIHNGGAEDGLAQVDMALACRNKKVEEASFLGLRLRWRYYRRYVVASNRCKGGDFDVLEEPRPRPSLEVEKELAISGLPHQPRASILGNILQNRQRSRWRTRMLQ